MAMAPGKADPVVARSYNGYKHFSGGKDDRQNNYDNLSFFETAAVNEDIDPVMADGEKDIEKMAEPNDAYVEGTPLAPWEDDKPGITVNYSNMSYIDQAHIFGAEGIEGIYRDLLDIVKAGGIPYYIETLIRESDRQEEYYV
jgi:hypothetical protein